MFKGNTFFLIKDTFFYNLTNVTTKFDPNLVVALAKFGLILGVCGDGSGVRSENTEEKDRGVTTWQATPLLKRQVMTKAFEVVGGEVATKRNVVHTA